MSIASNLISVVLWLTFIGIMVVSAYVRFLGIFCGMGTRDLTGGCYVYSLVLLPSLIIDALGLIVSLLTLRRGVAAVVVTVSVLTTVGCSYLIDRFH
jgi:hypothetical protein